MTDNDSTAPTITMSSKEWAEIEDSGIALGVAIKLLDRNGLGEEGEVLIASKQRLDKALGTVRQRLDRRRSSE